MKKQTLTGSHKITKADYAPDWYDVAALGGEDQRRYGVTLTVRITPDGAINLQDTTVDCPLRVIGRSTLVGWGWLDGPAYDVQADGYTYSMPADAWDALVAEACRRGGEGTI